MYYPHKKCFEQARRFAKIENNNFFYFMKGSRISALYLNYNDQYKYQNTINGTSYNADYSFKSSITGVRIGAIYGTQAFSFGPIAEYDKYDKSYGGISGQYIFGGAIASSSSNSLLELGFEIDPFAKSANPNVADPTPMKVSLLAEIKWGAVTLGYKGMAFKGRYQDLDRIIQTRLVFGDIGQDTRLEHRFNFSLGGTSGINLGGAASFSKTTTKEKALLFSSDNKHETQTQAIGLSGKLSYSF